MEFEATTLSMSASSTPRSPLVPADSSQSNISSSEYNQYCSPICIVGADLSRSMDRDDKCAEISGVIMEESMGESLTAGELKTSKMHSSVHSDDLVQVLILKI